ncbi:serine/threonine-protein kinase VRK1-like isoform X1 [Lethenteron reissneri]|uniref:serine/threonine-protein kinase VRK1-like isoform X1 n=1 Tax=Lethenteron reissneri TaxID=7753 RepID=UPI002AB7E950|nr:serine/threonine-protein kinase VRK1-like isoform X1 [Lethenteron reissneri]
MAPKRKAGGLHKLPELLAPGEVLSDVVKKEWKLGRAVGEGGFGRLYLAAQNTSQPVGEDADYVIKVEPHENGPLFTELKFYQRAAKPELIEKWVKEKRLKFLGVPRYWGMGMLEKKGSAMRFMVIDRFGSDLQKVLEENGKKIPRKAVLQLGLKLLDILEYIHDNEYVHADVKAANLMLGFKDKNQVSLVDYGLAYRYGPCGVHNKYKEDPKRCHDGTIEFTSIDAHKGVAPSRRADVQILGYCLLQWLCGKLPWEDNLKDPNYVRDAKIRFKDNIPELMNKCFPPSQEKPAEIAEYMAYAHAIGYEDRPDYQKLRTILTRGLRAIGGKEDDQLTFRFGPARTDRPAATSAKQRSAGTASARRKQQQEDGAGEVVVEPLSKKRQRSPATTPSSQAAAAAAANGRGRARPPVSYAELDESMEEDEEEDEIRLLKSKASSTRARKAPAVAPPSSDAGGAARGRKSAAGKAKAAKAKDLAETATQTTPSLARQKHKR